MTQTDSRGNDTLVRVEGLTKHFSVRIGAYGETKATVHALDDVSFHVRRGETLGLVGESGCGKSTAGLTMLQLHRPTSGKVLFKESEITGLSDKELRPLRQRMQIIFQDPYSTLSPRMTIGNAIGEPLWLHELATQQGAQERIAELLDTVGLNPAFAFRYPHEFSGGQRQRICIARALACEPEFIVCDEPISALDVSIQAQIINLLQDLQEEHRLTYLFIAHDLAVVRHISDRVAVMYLGRVVEMAPKDRLFDNPLQSVHQCAFCRPCRCPIRTRSGGASARSFAATCPAPSTLPADAASTPAVRSRSSRATTKFPSGGRSNRATGSPVMRFEGRVPAHPRIPLFSRQDNAAV